jgi:glycine/D-amino acid oxidase-like deaminating enzyme
LQPAKGEILTLAYDKPLPDVIYNFGNWLLPLKQGKIRLGATFDRELINTLPTIAGRESLLNKLEAYHPNLAQARIDAHQAGIRSCSLDKQPFVGRHPRYPQLAVFNGFGAKGSLQIPWYSRCFADYLLNQSPLPLTCDIQRYVPTHFPG